MFTVARGKAKYGRMGMALGRSLQLIQDQTPRAVLTDLDDFDWSRYFDLVIRPTSERTSLDKLLALELTKADQVLALDCDSLAFRRLDEIFEYGSGSSFAVQGFHQSSGIWHGADVREICKRFNRESIPRFNGGMLYYKRDTVAQSLIAKAKGFEASYGELGFVDFRGNASEEVCVALAMMNANAGRIWPDEMDFMSTGVGMIRGLQVDILAGKCEFVSRRERVRFIKPHVFHAARYVNFMFYWRQVRALEALELAEDRSQERG